MEVSGQLHTIAALPPGKVPPVPTGQEADCAQELVWMLWSREKSLAPGQNRTPAIQPVAHAISTELSWLPGRTEKATKEVRIGM
jgi:hypothetical protein